MSETQPPSRPLPAKRNNLMLAAVTPSYEELVSRRRLGQTHVPTPTHTKATYCHLPVPLPSDIFSDFTSTTTHYYLIRRLSDNFISATCLFRAVFPYANADEKIREFRYLKGIWKAKWDEMTGDVWVPAKQAMKLAEEYGCRRWVRALLDPKEVEAVPHEIIDLTLDDSEEEEEKEIQQDESEEARPEGVTREGRPPAEGEPLHGAFMRMAVMF